jgi:hypothetical protein
MFSSDPLGSIVGLNYEVEFSESGILIIFPLGEQQRFSQHFKSGVFHGSVTSVDPDVG